jgi:hypothetical protein
MIKPTWDAAAKAKGLTLERPGIAWAVQQQMAHLGQQQQQQNPLQTATS